MLVNFCCAAVFMPQLVLLELCSWAPGALLWELLLPKLLVLADSETSPLPFCNSVDTYLYTLIQYMWTYRSRISLINWIYRYQNAYRILSISDFSNNFQKFVFLSLFLFYLILFESKSNVYRDVSRKSRLTLLSLSGLSLSCERLSGGRALLSMSARFAPQSIGTAISLARLISSVGNTASINPPYQRPNISILRYNFDD